MNGFSNPVQGRAASLALLVHVSKRFVAYILNCLLLGVNVREFETGRDFDTLVKLRKA